MHPVDAIEHGALKVLLQHRAQRPRQAGIHGDREIERDDLPLLDQVGERRQRHAVDAVRILRGIVHVLRRAERVLHPRVVVEQRQEHADAFDDGRAELRLDAHPVVLEPALP